MSVCRHIFEWSLFLSYYTSLYYLIYWKSSLDIKHDLYDQIVLGMISVPFVTRFLILFFNTVKDCKKNENGIESNNYQAIL